MHERNLTGRLIRILFAALAVSTALLATGTAASAQERETKPQRPDGARASVCARYTDNTGDLCLYYYKGALGSRAAFYADDPEMSDNLFLTPGPGQDQSVKNNSEAYYNMDSVWTAKVCVKTYYAGSCMNIPPGVAGNFPPGFLNNVESVTWFH